MDDSNALTKLVKRYSVTFASYEWDNRYYLVRIYCDEIINQPIPSDFFVDVQQALGGMEQSFLDYFDDGLCALGVPFDEKAACYNTCFMTDNYGIFRDKYDFSYFLSKYLMTSVARCANIGYRSSIPYIKIEPICLEFDGDKFEFFPDCYTSNRLVDSSF